MTPKIYLAGPDIFLPNAQAIAARKKLLCTQHGFTPLHPLDDPPPRDLTPAATAMAIYQGNQARMRAADAIIANLTPFRSPSADPGTVFELGFMLALGRPAFGYSLTPRLFRQRTVAAIPGATIDPSTGRWHDASQAEIEDFGLHDNLMIDCALSQGGFPLTIPLHDTDEADDSLQTFERCLHNASMHLSQKSGA